MEKNNKIINCPFCNMDMTKLENTLIEETKFFYVTPSLGSIVDGYILIISKRHVNSMSELNKEEIEEYRILIRKYRKIFIRIYRLYPIIFEHGTPDLKDSVNASSVIHAHTHVVNHNFKNENMIIKNLKFKRFSNFENLFLNKNYIFYINPNNNIYITNEFEALSQRMRIEIAKDLKILDKYDWKKYEFDDNIILTVNKFKDYFNNDRGSDNND